MSHEPNCARSICNNTNTPVKRFTNVLAQNTPELQHKNIAVVFVFKRNDLNRF